MDSAPVSINAGAAADPAAGAAAGGLAGRYLGMRVQKEDVAKLHVTPEAG